MWVSYDEGLLNGQADMTTMKITAPTTSETAHPLYFDLIRLVEKLSRQSRDKVIATPGFSIEGGTRRLIAPYFGIYSLLLCV